MYSSVCPPPQHSTRLLAAVSWPDSLNNLMKNRNLHAKLLLSPRRAHRSHRSSSFYGSREHYSFWEALPRVNYGLFLKLQRKYISFYTHRAGCSRHLTPFIYLFSFQQNSWFLNLNGFQFTYYESIAFWRFSSVGHPHLLAKATFYIFPPMSYSANTKAPGVLHFNKA